MKVILPIGLFLLFSMCMQAPEGPEIQIWHGLHQRIGHLGIAQDDFNVLGNVTSENDSVVSLTYRLNDGPGIPLTVALQKYGEKRLIGKGDFNADIPISKLKMGENEIMLQAIDTKGNITETTLKVEKSQGNYPLPVLIKWSEIEDPQNVGQYVDGHWSLEESGLRTIRAGYDRIFLIGEKDWKDYEVTVPVTINGINGPNRPLHGGNGIGILMRFTGHINGGHRNFPEAQPKWGYQPFGAIGWLRWNEKNVEWPPQKQFFGGFSNHMVNHGDFQVESGQTYWMKMRCETLDEIHGDSIVYEEWINKWVEGKKTKVKVDEEELINPNSTRYSFKIWPDSVSEPEHWDWRQIQVSANALARGGVALVAHHVDATFGDVVIKPVETRNGTR